MTPRRTPRKTEHQLQAQCVQLFRANHPELALNLFAVPNGGIRDRTTGAMLKAEGATAGVADLLLLVPSHDGRHHGLCIEMKTTERGSVQRETQKQWQEAVEAQGYRYEVCRTKNDFRDVICSHLGQSPTEWRETPPAVKKSTRRGSLRFTIGQLKAIGINADMNGSEK